MFSQEELLHQILKAASSYEFNTFLIGTKNTEKLSREELRQKYHPQKAFLGTSLLKQWPEKQISFEAPELLIEFCPITGALFLTSAPVFIAGRYRKLSREITSSYWLHNRCKGKGCFECDQRGTLFSFSIETFLKECFLPQFEAENSKFHAMGREDIDVLMLGNGRPFVFELHRPKKRWVDLTLSYSLLQDPRAEIHSLTYTDRESVFLIKESEPPKEYRARICYQGKAPLPIQEKLETLIGTQIQQRTPRRVEKRRVDIWRVRKIHHLVVEESKENFLVLRIKADAGTYIKELVSGDEGRTVPSISSLLGITAICEQLDVLDICWKAPWEKEKESC